MTAELGTLNGSNTKPEEKVEKHVEEEEEEHEEEEGEEEAGHEGAGANGMSRI